MAKAKVQGKKMSAAESQAMTAGFKAGVAASKMKADAYVEKKKAKLAKLPKSQQSDVEACIQCAVAIGREIAKLF